MNLMYSRLMNLELAYAGLLRSAHYLVDFDGVALKPCITGDDAGIYIIIPWLARQLGVSLDFAVVFFFNALLLVPLIIGISFILIAARTILSKGLGIIFALLIARFAYAVGDVYLASYAAIMIVIPFALWLAKRESWNLKICLTSGCAIGVLFGFLHSIRSFSFLGAGVFFFTTLLPKNIIRWNLKLLLILSVLIAGAIPGFILDTMCKKTDAYFERNGLPVERSQKKHVLWHQVYIGLGLLNHPANSHIQYEDSSAAQKVKEYNPEVAYCSAEYEAILQNEVMDFIKKNFSLFLITLFAKIGLLLGFFIKFANVGILSFIYGEKCLRKNLPFLLALIGESLFSIIAVPIHEYALGYIVTSTLWAFFVIDELFKSNFLRINFLKSRARKAIMNPKNLTR